MSTSKKGVSGLEQALVRRLAQREDDVGCLALAEELLAEVWLKTKVNEDSFKAAAKGRTAMKLLPQINPHAFPQTWGYLWSAVVEAWLEPLGHKPGEEEVFIKFIAETRVGTEGGTVSQLLLRALREKLGARRSRAFPSIFRFLKQIKLLGSNEATIRTIVHALLASSLEDLPIITHVLEAAGLPRRPAAAKELAGPIMGMYMGRAFGIVEKMQRLFQEAELPADAKLRGSEIHGNHPILRVHWVLQPHLDPHKTAKARIAERLSQARKAVEVWKAKNVRDDAFGVVLGCELGSSKKFVFVA